MMAYRYGNRYQMALLPQSIEEYVAQDNPVRAYDALVKAIDLGELGIDFNPYRVGNSEYDPKTMVKLLVYGYSYGVKSSRKLERECYHNIAFIWLMGGLKPDHKTIAEFRRRNRNVLKKILRSCAQVCVKLDLIAGNVLFADGTRIRANASRGRTHDRSWYEKALGDIDRRIEELLNECETIDHQEQGSVSYVAMNKELAKSQNLKSEIQKALEVLEVKGKKQVNQTDPDCAIMHSVQGSHASYNVQSVVDDKHGLIVHAEAVNDTSDVNQFARQIEQANQLFENPCEAACADAGYADTDELEKVDGQGIKVVVPSQRQALHKEEGSFSKSHFIYDADQGSYICPEGQRLSYQSTDKDTGKRSYQVRDPKICHGCKHLGKCTTAKKGRKVIRLKNEETKQRLEPQYEEPASQEIYARRKSRVEHPFGHIKRNLKTDGFLMRGKDGVQAETSLFATCFNVARMITLCGGVTGVIQKLSGLRLQKVKG
jgi:transposase